MAVVYPTGGASAGGVTAVTASGPLASSGGNTPDISLTGVVPVANGGTGSAVQNFVDLTTAQNIAGVKTFTTDGLNLAVAANAATTFTINNTAVGTAATARLSFGNDSGASRGAIRMTSSGFTPTATVLADMLVVSSAGVGGLAFNTTTANAITFSINSVAAGSFTSGGNLSLTPTAGTTGLLLNAPSGFASNLFDFQVNAVSKGKLDQSGKLTLTGDISIPASSGLGITGATNNVILKNIGGSSGLEQTPFTVKGGVSTLTFTGSPAIQRSNYFENTTLAGSGGARTIADSATVAIQGEPIQGASMTLTRAYQLWLQGTGKMRIDTTTQTTIGATGAASALPALPLGYLPIYVGTTLVAIPYYNP